MSGSNGTKPQHHFTAKEMVARAMERRSERWHWGALDLDVLIRPRTTAENGAIGDEERRLQAAIAEYKGTADEPASLEQLRVAVRSMVRCVLDPETKASYFTDDDVETLLEMDTASLSEAITKVNEVSNLTQAQAEAAAKNSAAMAGVSTSSVSPSEPETPGSSPTPIRSAG